MLSALRDQDGKLVVSAVVTDDLLLEFSTQKEPLKDASAVQPQFVTFSGTQIVGWLNPLGLNISHIWWLSLIVVALKVSLNAIPGTSFAVDPDE